jgi:DNA polymerase-3 subunit beta
VLLFSPIKQRQIRLKIAGAELNVSAEDIDYSNKAEERLTCDYQGICK